MPSLYRELRWTRPRQGGGTIDEVVGILRRRGLIEEIGKVRTEVFYAFPAKGVKALLGADEPIEMLRSWTNRK